MKWMSGLLPVIATTLVHLHWVALKHQTSNGSPRGHRRAHTPLLSLLGHLRSILVTARGRCETHLQQVKGRRILNMYLMITRKNPIVLKLWVSVSRLAQLLWHSGGSEVVSQSRGSNFYRLSDPTPPSIRYPSFTLVLFWDCASGGLWHQISV